VEVGHLQAKFTRKFLAHIVPPSAARISRRRLVAKSWKHLNYKVTTPAFSAEGAWQRGTGGESWNVKYGDDTISYKVEGLPEA